MAPWRRQLLLHVRHAQHVDEVLVQLVDDLLRRARGHERADPRQRLEPGRAPRRPSARPAATARVGRWWPRWRAACRALTCGVPEAMLSNITWIRPLIRSVYAAGVPLYGTWIILVPVAVLNSSPARWFDVPMPPEPKFTSPGSLRVRDELLHVLAPAGRGAHHHDQRRGRHQGDRREVLEVVVVRASSRRWC